MSIFATSADELQGVAPDVVFEDRHNKGQMGYRKDAMIALLWSAVRELNDKINKLK